MRARLILILLPESSRLDTPGSSSSQEKDIKHTSHLNCQSNLMQYINVIYQMSNVLYQL